MQVPEWPAITNSRSGARAPRLVLIIIRPSCNARPPSRAGGPSRAPHARTPAAALGAHASREECARGEVAARDATRCDPALVLGGARSRVHARRAGGTGGRHD